MLYYEVPSGLWVDRHGMVLVTGCEAGNDNMGRDMNNVASQALHNRGPLPVGKYRIGELAYQPAVRSWGCQLIPFPDNQMFGRSGFYLHLRNLQHLAPDGTNASSDGCITFATDRGLRAIAAAAAADDGTFEAVGLLPQFPIAA